MFVHGVLEDWPLIQAQAFSDVQAATNALRCLRVKPLHPVSKDLLYMSACVNKCELKYALS